nr:protein ZINC INDUCED FACILITATOR-LIKE 1-like isoform X1 [Ipomoea batatas]
MEMASESGWEYNEALLQKGEKCPGCKVEQQKELQTQIPLKMLITIWSIVLCTSLSITCLFPFIYFMIRDFQIAETEKDIGKYAGYVGSAFMLGRALTSVFWGRMADRFGRKPVIIFGTTTVVIFNTLFGFSVNFWMAVITRFLLGSLNGLLGPINAFSAEFFHERYLSLGMSAICTSWGIGLIIGPAIGGFLAQPAEKYPSLFSADSLFGRFPYLLPCLCISLFALAVTISSFWLPETLHKHDSASVSACGSYRVSEVAPQVAEDVGKPTPRKSIYKNWPLMSAIIIYCVFCLDDIAYTEIFSLWAESPRRLGGLSYSTNDVGVVLAISGFSLLAFQVLLYHRVERAFGPITIMRVAGIMSIPLLTSYPYIANLSGITLSLVLNCASLIKNILGTAIITGLLILQNKAVEQDQRAAANGIATTGMSIFKTVGPIGAGALFSWSEKRQDAAFLPGNHMVFFVMNVIEGIGVLLTLKPFLVVREVSV